MQRMTWKTAPARTIAAGGVQFAGVFQFHEDFVRRAVEFLQEAGPS